ncbi:hypothetical protein [Flavobacterium sp.]|uniref:hypothetical protein n=1 Tax=Flavobacterium sp. TaxID=239 RepID=UPI00391B680F
MGKTKKQLIKDVIAFFKRKLLKSKDKIISCNVGGFFSIEIYHDFKKQLQNPKLIKLTILKTKS